jgi:hypothetical protein
MFTHGEAMKPGANGRKGKMVVRRGTPRTKGPLGTVADTIRRLIMDGNKCDVAIHKRAERLFGKEIAANAVIFYRAQLKAQGCNPPAPKA